ncbi:MAG: hypothetical protein HC908_11125 [Calothrix sp. SM1_7_51]|nr:hypothetical protein [Calothrix sp. SM1_7_51]
MNISNSQQQPTVRENSISSLSSQHVELLQQLTQLINQKLTDLGSLLNLMVKEIHRMIDNADFCFVALSNSQTQNLEVHAASGIEIDNINNKDFLGKIGRKKIIKS